MGSKNRTKTEQKPNNTYLPPLDSLGKTKRDVLMLLVGGDNPTRIAKKLSKAKSTVSQHLEELCKLGFVYKDCHIWHLTNQAKSVKDIKTIYKSGGVRFSRRVREGAEPTIYKERLFEDRLHNVKVKFPVMSAPDKDSWLDGWRPNDRMRNNVFYSRSFNGVTMTYTGRSLIFQLPPMLFDDSDDAVAEVGSISIKLAEDVKALFPGLVLGDYKISCQLISQSHAIPNEPFARWCFKNNLSYRGDVVEIDASKGPELEFPTVDKSHEHIKRYVDYAEDVVVKAKLMPSQIEGYISEIAVAQLTTQKQLSSLVKILSPGGADDPEDRIKKPEYFG